MKASSIETRLASKIKAIAPYAEIMPSVVIIQQLDPFTTCYMNEKGLSGLGITSDELKEMGEDYLRRFFNLEDMEDYLIKLERLLQTPNPEETFSFFQQVKLKDNNNWVWHIGATRVFMRNSDGLATHLITTAIPVEELKHIPFKAARLLAENEFLRNNMGKFLRLGKRAKEVLRLVALGKSSAEIAEELNISVETVHTHRKQIKLKLGISTTFQFTEYALAFDLI